MPEDDPPTRELKLRQLEQERVSLKKLEDADTEALAEQHQRRADKASYLREKLEERERSEREAAAEDEPPPAA